LRFKSPNYINFQMSSRTETKVSGTLGPKPGSSCVSGISGGKKTWVIVARSSSNRFGSSHIDHGSVSRIYVG
jgi:hypothetical protein